MTSRLDQRSRPGRPRRIGLGGGGGGGGGGGSVAAPTSLTTLDSIQNVDVVGNMNAARDVALMPNHDYAYVCTNANDLIPIDISDPSALADGGTALTSNGQELRVINDDYIIMASGGNLLRLIDVSTKSAPVMGHQLATGSLDNNRTISYVDGEDYVYSHADTDGDRYNILSLDLVTPLLTLTARYSSGSADGFCKLPGRDIAIGWTGARLDAIDVSDPELGTGVNLPLLDSHTMVGIGQPYRMEVNAAGTKVLIVSGNNDRGAIVDVADTSAMSVETVTPALTTDCQGAAWDDGEDYVFITNQFSIYCYAATDMTTPVFTHTAAFAPSGLRRKGDILWATSNAGDSLTAYQINR